MTAVVASQQSLIKSDAKDESYIKTVHSKFINIFQQILGDHLFLKWKAELDVVSSILYFYLTTLQGSQTLGEEYSGIIQTDLGGKNVPTKFQSLSFAFIQSAWPYIMMKVVDYANYKVQIKSTANLKCYIQYFIMVVKKINMLAFYINGGNFSIAKRIIGIKHWLIRPYASDEIDSQTFYWLANLEFIQLLTVFLKFGYELKLQKFSEEIKKTTDKSGIESKSLIKTKCILCFQSIQLASSTFCGHVFCWQCIIEWTTAKNVLFVALLATHQELSI
ncbi:peroxisome biogenesis factor 10 isoform X6 [Hydra vulgaris]|uniref:RING-type E3 ubiquitin transferase n=1 Tax=Hydra vulgaris TaxID=6087 RepID=A0ABM4C320_HYDVU